MYSVQLGYSGSDIESFRIRTKKGVITNFGKTQVLVKSWKFSETNKFAGFYGDYDETSIETLGIIIFRKNCPYLQENLKKNALISPDGFSTFSEEGLMKPLEE